MSTSNKYRICTEVHCTAVASRSFTFARTSLRALRRTAAAAAARKTENSVGPGTRSANKPGPFLTRFPFRVCRHPRDPRISPRNNSNCTLDFTRAAFVLLLLRCIPLRAALPARPLALGIATDCWRTSAHPEPTKKNETRLLKMGGERGVSVLRAIQRRNCPTDSVARSFHHAPVSLFFTFSCVV